MTQINKSSKVSEKNSLVLIGNKKNSFANNGLSKSEKEYIKKALEEDDKKVVLINQYKRWIYVVLLPKKKEDYQTLEAIRCVANKLLATINQAGNKSVEIVSTDNKPEEALAFAEGMALGNYQFLKYKSKKFKKENALKNIFINDSKISEAAIKELELVVNTTNCARDLVNEPVITLTAVQLSKEIQKLGKEYGFKTEVFNKSKIQSLKMGGLLAVNYGSEIPPTFNIMEWKPKKPKNKKPYVLVGKGVVYDTGGLSLKPTPNSMDMMKSDMAGAAVTIASMAAIAKAKLPVHVIALVPATDNRPGKNAYTPGDVITMHNGMSVEVLNTDAEGRMILADALSYAQKYDPELVIDLATLTGAAAMAIAEYGIVAMGTASEKQKNKLKKSGEMVYERIAELPFWEEYGDLVKSNIADIKNIGGPKAGAITAGKFLEHFTDYPWIHLDIAGPSYLLSPMTYHPVGGSGIGVRLLFNFFKNT